jgi:hypothetical protein
MAAMKRAVARSIGLTVAMLFAATASAQFGHPLKGTWSGEWGGDKQRVLLNLNWDGKQITGTINPGPNEAAIKTATIDHTTWALKLEAEGKDRTGAVVKYVIDGKLENLGAYQRFITGTWTQGTQKGEFKVVRN